MTIHYSRRNFSKSLLHPVFQGLEISRLTGRDIAAIVGVSPPTVSKWRAGKTRIPAATLVFLTLLLAHWLDELEELIRVRAGTGQAFGLWRRTQEEHLMAGRKRLGEQERLNMTMTAEVLNKGARLFRDWWCTRAPVRSEIQAHEAPLATDGAALSGHYGPVVVR